MGQYVNPTGTFNATAGDDSIFNVDPGPMTTVVDALGGSDSLFAQLGSAMPMFFYVQDVFASGSFKR